MEKFLILRIAQQNGQLFNFFLNWFFFLEIVFFFELETRRGATTNNGQSLESLARGIIVRRIIDLL